MAETVTKTSTVSTAYGMELPSPIKFDYSFEELAKGDEIPEDEQPDAEELLNFVNNKRGANARSKAQAEALKNAGVVKPDLKNESVQIATMKKVFLATGKYTEETALQAAKAALGL